jgi:threonine-phosphate decarboxylase
MLCKLSKRTAAELKDYLVREHRMLIRDASNFNGLTARHFRVASQTPEENDALVAAINQFLANG